MAASLPPVEQLLGLLRMRVVKGMNLAARDAFASDPYVVLKMGEQVSCLFTWSEIHCIYYFEFCWWFSGIYHTSVMTYEWPLLAIVLRTRLLVYLLLLNCELVQFNLILFWKKLSFSHYLLYVFFKFTLLHATSCGCHVSFLGFLTLFVPPLVIISKSKLVVSVLSFIHPISCRIYDFLVWSSRSSWKYCRMKYYVSFKCFIYRHIFCCRNWKHV